MEQCLPPAEVKKKKAKQSAGARKKNARPHASSAQNVREVSPSYTTERHEEKSKIPKDSVSTSSKLSASHENLSDSNNATGPELLMKMKSSLKPVGSPAQSDRDANQSQSSEYGKAPDTEKESRTVHSDLSASSTEGSGILKKIKKGLRPAESTGESDRNINQSENTEEYGTEADTQKESLTASSKLSASNDDLPDNKKTSGLLKGMKKKLGPGTPAAQTIREINQSESAEDHGGENDAQKGSGIMKKIKQSLRPAQPTPQSGKDIDQSDDGQDQREATNTRKGSLGANLELSASNDSLSDKRKESLTPHGELSASSDRLSDNGKEEGPGILNKIKKRFIPMRSPIQEDESMSSEMSSSNDSLLDANAKEKGGMFSGMFKSKSQQSSKDPTSPLDSVSGRSELSASIDSLSENSSSKISADSDAVESTQTHSTTEKEEPSENTQSKGGKFIGMFRKPPKPTDRSLPVQENESEPTEHSANDSSRPDVNMHDKQDKITDWLRRTPKPADRNRLPQKNDSASSELSVNNDASAEGPLDVNTKEKGGMFSGIFKKSSKPAESTAPPQEEEAIQSDLSSSNDSLLDISAKEKGGMFSGMFRSKSPKHPKESASAPDSQSDLSASNDSLSEKSSQKTATESSQSESADNNEETDNRQDRGRGIFWKTPKDRTATFTSYVIPKEHEAITDNKQEKGMFSAMFRSKSPKYSKDATTVQDDPSAHNEPGSSIDSPPDNNAQISSDTNFVDPLQADSTDAKQEPPESTQRKGGKLPGLFRKSPKPAESSLPEQEEEPLMSELSASKENLLDVPAKEKGGMFSGMFRSKSPKRSEDRTSAQGNLSDNIDSLSENTKVAAERGTSVGENEKREQPFRRKRKVSFRVKRTVPRFPGVTLQPHIEEDEELLPESVEMQELPPMQENSVEVEMVEMAPFTSDNEVQEDDDDDLLHWWRTVEGWNEWNETSNFREDEEEEAVEQAADRVYLAAQLFVRLFNQRGASLQRHILDLVSMADAADNFHKRALKASMGGRVASVVGSVTTITGLILAPFTFGSSIIVTAVGIGVATAGTITSASAHITDSVHSTLDRKKVEKIIQDYEGEIKDIRECMEFVQAGMDALQGWNFEKYTDSVAKRALNRNIKHVVKEGARAGKALMINTDKLVNTVQILSVAGGAAKAAQAISVTTGVMSALFLALDIFFLAKDSHDLRKGAKTKFAKKLRDVCKELQDGLLELNRVKTELQKTMDGVEVEEFEEEVEEVEDDEDSDLESDPVKLAELEEEISLIEQKLDQEVLERKKQMEERKELRRDDGTEEQTSEGEKVEKGEKKEESLRRDGEAKTEKRGKAEGVWDINEKAGKKEDFSEERMKGNENSGRRKESEGDEVRKSRGSAEGDEPGEKDRGRGDERRNSRDERRRKELKEGDEPGGKDREGGDERRNSRDERRRKELKEGDEPGEKDRGGGDERRNSRDERRRKEIKEGDEPGGKDRGGGDERRNSRDERRRKEIKEGDEPGGKDRGGGDERRNSRDERRRKEIKEGDEPGGKDRGGGDERRNSRDERRRKELNEGDEQWKEGERASIPPPARPRSRAISQVAEETEEGSGGPVTDPEARHPAPRKKRSSCREPLAI